MAGIGSARLLGFHDRERALAFLTERADENLVLIDLVERIGAVPRAGEMSPQVYGAFAGGRLAGIAALRPSVALSIDMQADALETLLPRLGHLSSGLVKCDRTLAEPVWKLLESRGRRAMIDRIEIAYRLGPERIVAADAGLPGVARPARPADLEDLVFAARASLWEEDRPDPADGDPEGFRRWVQSRLSRARIVAEGDQLAFVAYADVRRPQGWLIQGVYTWPEMRRRGYARRGMDSIVREAFASGADHVQLAVVEGNERAFSLYRGLGFEPFAELRTILFH